MGFALYFLNSLHNAFIECFVIQLFQIFNKSFLIPDFHAVPSKTWKTSLSLTVSDCIPSSIA